MSRLRLTVAVATRGRPEWVASLLARLSRQTRPPDEVILSAARREDIPDSAGGAVLRFGPVGVAAQRNRALEASTGDVTVFFDDDFIPAPEALAAIEALFAERPEVAGATGRVLADGARGAPIPVARAETLIARAAPIAAERPVIGLYGCNMAIRMAAAEGLRFDESLPLYGWQEDLDFGARLSSRGAVIWTGAFHGVHVGAKSGRHPQRGLGYAQVANPVRLMEKRAIPRAFLLRMMASNLFANAAGAIRGDPWADRPGRLSGNLTALADLALGRLDPARATRL